MTVITELTVRQRVDAGWAVMDEQDSGWWRADASLPVDLAVLDLDEVDLCILGQRCPLEMRSAQGPDPYTAYLLALAGQDPSPFYYATDWAQAHGFYPASDEDSADLRAEWFRRITERRAAA